MFAEIEPRGVDALMALMQAFKDDPRENKVDLVVGVYKDAEGRVPVLDTVKMAEARLLEGEDTKTYLGVKGDPAFNALIPPLLFGAGSDLAQGGRALSLQTPGGCGALRVACELIASLAPEARLWVSDPTWANHVPIARGARLSVATYPYFRAADRALDAEGMLATLEAETRPGDALLLHACCHNPTGVDLGPAEWAALTDLVLRKGLLPLVDCAYQGFGDGLEEDVAGLRHMAERVPEMLVASSFSKNFAIYRERTGAVTMLAAAPDQAARVMASATGLTRASYSMPPSHGARVVTTVMQDPALRTQWEGEVAEMRGRIAGVREALKAALEARQVSADLSFLTRQKGMFSYTGFSPDAVARLRSEFGVFLAEDGRMNVAGISPATIDPVADAFAAILRD